MSALAELGVVEAATAVAGGDLSPRELLDAQLAQSDALDGEVRAWRHLDRDAARAEADALTNEALAGSLRGPLHGVPVGVKDIFHVRGMPTRAGTDWLDAAPQAEDCTVVRRLREAGALILGKLHTTQFAYMDPAPTRNPWNLARTPGGSSAGSGAAVGARMVTAALGTQTSGSTLRPAAYCGVAALKPSYGRLSRHGLLALSWSLDHPGVIARSVSDLALVLSVAAGRDPLDPTTLHDAPPPATPAIDGTPGVGKVGIVRGFFEGRVSQPMRDAVARAAVAFEAAGATVVEVALPEEFALLPPAAAVIMQTEVAAVHARRYAEHREGYRPGLAAAVETGALVPAGFYLHALRIRARLRQRLLSLFDEAGVLLMPAVPAAAPAGLETTGDPSMLGPWTALGYPAATINGGLSPEGLPLGLQLVAPPLADEALLAAAAWCERVLGTLGPPPLAAEALRAAESNG